MQKCTINGQSAVLNLTNEQLQVLVSGKFGDGSLNTPKSEKSNATFSTNCIYEEYLKFKKYLLGDLSFNITSETNRGYKENTIYRLSTKASEDITKIRNMSIEEALKLIDDLGVALWFYDDGSLHKTKLFYNLNTQAFSEEVNRDIFVPFFKNLILMQYLLLKEKRMVENIGI